MRGFWTRLGRVGATCTGFVRNPNRRRLREGRRRAHARRSSGGDRGTALAVTTRRSSSTATSTTFPLPAGRVDWDNDIVGVSATGYSPPRHCRTGFSAHGGARLPQRLRRGVEIAVQSDDSTFTTNKRTSWTSPPSGAGHANNVTDKGTSSTPTSLHQRGWQLILYFGAEKNDERHQRPRGVVPPGPTGLSTPWRQRHRLHRAHVIGDILLVSKFTNGEPRVVTAYVWDPRIWLR